jgi:hypothetical protein
MAGRGGLTCGLTALIALLAVAATAEAKFDATDVRAAKVREKSFTPDGVEPVGGSVECPNDGHALAGGAFWREPPSNKPVQPEAVGFPTLSASIPTAEGDGWYAHGQSGQGETLTIRVLCSRAEHFNDYFAIGSTLNTDDGDPAGSSEECDPGDVAFTGGSSWATGFGQEDPDHAGLGVLASNAPGEDRRSWYSDGADTLDGDPIDVHIVRSVRCLPNKRVAKTVISAGSTSAGNDDEAAAKAKCPGRMRAIAGGAIWHTGGGDPNLFTNVGISGGSSVATKDRRGWFAHGYNDSGGFRTLTVRVLCVK